MSHWGVGDWELGDLMRIEMANFEGRGPVFERGPVFVIFLGIRELLGLSVLGGS